MDGKVLLKRQRHSSEYTTKSGYLCSMLVHYSWPKPGRLGHSETISKMKVKVLAYNHSSMIVDPIKCWHFFVTGWEREREEALSTDPTYSLSCKKELE